MGLRHLSLDELLQSGQDHDGPGIGPDHIWVKITAVDDLPSRFGDFHIVASWSDRDQKDHVAIVDGDPFDAEDVSVRIHSECLTGDALGGRARPGSRWTARSFRA